MQVHQQQYLPKQENIINKGEIKDEVHRSSIFNKEYYEFRDRRVGHIEIFNKERERSKSPISNSTTKFNYASRPTRESSSSRERRKPKKCCRPNRGEKKEGRRKERRQ